MKTKDLPKRQKFKLSGVRFNKPVDPSERQGRVNDINDKAARESRAGVWTVRTDAHRRRQSLLAHS